MRVAAATGPGMLQDAKRDAASYARIASATTHEPADLLFLSDVVEELDAARQAGLPTCGLVRAGGQLGDHPCVASFADIDLAAFA